MNTVSGEQLKQVNQNRTVDQDLLFGIRTIWYSREYKIPNITFSSIRMNSHPKKSILENLNRQLSQK